MIVAIYLFNAEGFLSSSLLLKLLSISWTLQFWHKYGEYNNTGVNEEYYGYFLAMKQMAQGLLTF